MKMLKVLLLILVLFSCKQEGDFVIRGRIFFNGKPIDDAEVQVYLKEAKEKETPPIKVVATDKDGMFQIKLPAGKYFLVAKKKSIENGEIDMLFGNYPGNPVNLSKDITLEDWSLESKKSRGQIAKDTGIIGKVKGFKNYRFVKVYAYKDLSTGLKGPDFVNKAKIDESGSFAINLPKGQYYLVVRERRHGDYGLLKEGDYSGEYEKNPVIVPEKGYREIEPITLRPVNSKKVTHVNREGIVEAGIAEVEGIVVDRNNKPVKNIYVLFYDNPEMVGRPQLISTPTDNSGKFMVRLRKEGKYYIGARSKIGGPAEPGELIGTYMGSQDKGLVVKRGDRFSIKLEVQEVW